MKHSYLTKIITICTLSIFTAAPAVARLSRPAQSPLDDADPDAVRCLIAHDLGNIRTTMSNWGEYGNPDGIVGYKGFEYPINSGNDFLFSAGIWIAAEIDGQRFVSTGTDGDNGTNELYPVHLGTIPLDNQSTYFNDWWSQSQAFSTHQGWNYVLGVYGVDDDGDWTAQTDDLNGDLLPSRNWDGGGGILSFDDDEDNLIDEEAADGVDNDGDGLVDEDTVNGDANGDGDASYDPEPHIDEDPAGNMAADWLDNDHDGLTDSADPDFDGDCCPLSLDDDGDELEDEDAAARAEQEFRTVYHDDIQVEYVNSPDPEDPHDPLGVAVSQQSYVWSSDLGRNIVLLEFTVRNFGSQSLENVHLAFFADPDIGAMGEGGDAASLDDSTFYDAQRRMAIATDNTTDADGPGPGVFAAKVVKPPIPWSDARFTYANFERVSGGDPSNDADKFALISSGQIAPASPQHGDWRMVMGWGSLDSIDLAPGETMSFTVAMIGAADLTELYTIADRLPVFDAGPAIGEITLYTSPESLGPYILSAPFSDDDGIDFADGVFLHWLWAGHESAWTSASHYSYVWSDPETGSGDYYFVLPDTHANGSNVAEGDTIVFYCSGEDGFGNFSAHAAYSLIAGDSFLRTEKHVGVLEGFVLHPNYPNPFNATTNLSFAVPHVSRVTLTLFDITGRQARSLYDGWYEPGYHSLSLDARDLPSGIYFVQMSASDFSATQKLLLIK